MQARACNCLETASAIMACTQPIAGVFAPWKRAEFSLFREKRVRVSRQLEAVCLPAEPATAAVHFCAPKTRPTSRLC